MCHHFIANNQNSLTDALTAFAALVAAGVAVYGIMQWKLQLRGKTDYEIARRYLRASLKVRDAMKFVRNPFIPPQEQQTALKEHGFNSEEDTGETDHQKTNRAVYSLRWKKVIEAWTELEAELLEAEVSWGKEAIEAQKPLDDLVRKLRSVVTLFLRGNSRPGEEDLIYDMGEDDVFSQQVTTAIKKIEDYLKPYLR